MRGLFRRLPFAAMALSGIVLMGVAAAENPAQLSEGQFFSDGATYYSMGWSLVHDFDFEYTATDLARVRREYPNGPTGIFLKRASGGVRFDASPPWLSRVSAEEKRIYFGKAMTYPILAAPFVAIMGTRGFVVFNSLCLLAAWLCAHLELRRRTSDGRALIASAALILATIAPIYVLWIQPELMNLALVSVGLLAWRRDRPVLSALVFGIAAYTKPTQILMALPLGLAPLFQAEVPGVAKIKEVIRRGAVILACTLALFGANALVTGEWNYQGGERKTFVSEFPYDRAQTRDVSFGNSGEWMTTMKLGPLEEGEEQTRGSGIVQAPKELNQMFLENLADFWVGRYAGMLPYFAPAFLALLAFLVLGPREREGWLAVSALILFYLVSIRILPGPTNWYGGGGTVGNRYFMAALPLAPCFLPRGRELVTALLGIALSALFLLPAWLQPMQHSLRPALLASYPEAPLTLLPAERAMLNDLSFCTDAWRKKQPYDDVEGDPVVHRPGAKHGYWLYFPDDGSFGREIIPGMFRTDGEPMEGFRVRRGETTEVLLRANEPVDWIDVTLFGVLTGDDVEVDAGAASQRALVPPSGSVALRIFPGPSVMYYDSFVYSLHARSRAVSFPEATEHTMIRLALHVSPRPSP